MTPVLILGRDLSSKYRTYFDISNYSICMESIKGITFGLLLGEAKLFGKTLVLTRTLLKLQQLLML